MKKRWKAVVAATAASAALGGFSVGNTDRPGPKVRAIQLDGGHARATEARALKKKAARKRNKKEAGSKRDSGAENVGTTASSSTQPRSEPVVYSADSVDSSD